jgi:hypothetical protein
MQKRGSLMFNGKLGPVVDSEAGICTSKKSPMKFGLLYEMETPRPWHALSEYNTYREALAQHLGSCCGTDGPVNSAAHEVQPHSFLRKRNTGGEASCSPLSFSTRLQKKTLIIV